uniref:Ribosomal protein S11 n=1 Tax=Acanthamoeba castellanii TaxID=5755 RepID=A0A0K1HP79_ACACA|nr:ribosomal protein S11 [Acanthamoeba castellanii]
MKILKSIIRRKTRSQKKILIPRPSKFRTRWHKKPKKNYVSFRQRLVLAKKNPNKKRYYLFCCKKRNNVFLTITDVMGRVIISQSAGSCKITTKKKKRSPDTLKTISTSVAKVARAKNIKYLFKFFMSTNQTKMGKTIFDNFKKLGLLILQGVVVKNKSHGLLMRKKKAKRL